MSDAKLAALERENRMLRASLLERTDTSASPVFEHIDIPLWLMTMDRDLCRANIAMRKMWPDLNDNRSLNALPPSLQQEIYELMTTALTHDRALSELMLDWKGQAIILSISAVKIPGFVVFSAQEITAQVSIAEQLEEARDEALRISHLKGQFVANMSHEIRTPLNGIVGMLELLSLTELSDQQAHYVSTGRQAAQLLFHLIEDILDFSRIEAGKVSLIPTDLDLQHLINRALQPSAVAAEQKGLELLVSFAPSLPASVVVDGSRLAQLLVNLVGNATKFTDEGHILVSFDSGCEPNEDDEFLLRICVKDTGPGITAAQQKRIFEQFVQADGSMARKAGGSGLGLAICKNLVLLMGGRIWLESTPGEGSEFWLEFPVLVGSGSRPVDPSVLRGARAILIDPNPTSLDILQRTLDSWDMSVLALTEAQSVRHHLAAATQQEDPYRFVICASQALRGLEQQVLIPDSEELCSIILLSPSQTSGQEARSHCITKPISPSELLETLIDCLAESERVAPTAEKAGQRPPRASLNVLVVDDNEINREVAKGMLESRGHQVQLAVDGFAALEQLEIHQFDCVLLDIQMPGLTGTDLLQIYFETDRTTHPRFIAMTAHAMAGDREQFLQLGFHDYVAKPMTMESLNAAVDNIPAAEPKKEPQQPRLSFDGQAILERAGLNNARAIRMCEILFQLLDPALEKIRVALKARNLTELATQCHSLASMIGNFGSPAGPVARKMELCATRLQLDEASALLSALEFECASTREALTHFVSTLRSEA